MKRILTLMILLTFPLFAQTETRLLSYDVSVAMNERTRETAGSVRFAARMADTSSQHFSFLIPAAWTIKSLRNGYNGAYDNDRSAGAAENFDLITLDLADMNLRRDSLAVDIEFTALFDSSSFENLFINQREFLLPYGSSVSWLPQFGAMTAERFSLEFRLSQQFTVISEESFDTISFNGIRTWKRSGARPVSLSSAFTLCGLQNAALQRSVGPDSLCSISLYSSPVKFNQQYASAITRQLTEAAQFFAAVTGQQRITTVSYAIIGDAGLEQNVFSSKNFIIERNSPAYTVLDSAAIKHTSYNRWLLRLARQFCPANTDSTAVFDDGFASYLAMRFLISSYPSIERQERFNVISNALTFFPSGILSAGHTVTANTDEFVSNRGRYLFLMLEYLLGRDSFDSVITAASRQFSETTITFNDFQVLCEKEYGSSLAWFFDQWLFQSAAPEYVLQWNIETTPRGMSIIRATIEQRGAIFSMPVPIVFSFQNRTVTRRILVEQPKQEFTFSFPQAPTGVELDPGYSILRWLLEIRISAHAKTSLQFLSVNRDIINAEREALYTLQLDPNNSTGSAPLAYFVLGNISVVGGNNERAKEYFLKSASSSGTEETERYTLLSMIRYANVLEQEGKRNEAFPFYQRANAEGLKNPLKFDRAVIESDNYMRERFIPNSDVWFDIH